ncbi:selenoprotein T2-like [Arapaima gigas]
MAEYSQAGILTALLLFTVVTVRDIYLGKNMSDGAQQQAAESPDLESRSSPSLDPQRTGKPRMYIGPVLRFQFCKVYQEYSRSISQLYPDIRIEGENYPPKPINKYLANFISYFKFLIIALIVSGQNPFPFLGMDTPTVWSWGQENKIFSCLMMFFLSNMLETHFLSTGAFEITLNDVPIWSKLQSGRNWFPSSQTSFSGVHNRFPGVQDCPVV